MTKKTIKRDNDDVGMMFNAFNLSRLINIIGKNEFKKCLEGLVLSIYEIFDLNRAVISNISRLNFQSIFHDPNIKVA